MFSELIQHLSSWSSLDTWIVATAALAAMACALPGCYLVLRRQSMMGDAVSHTVLVGIVVAFLFAHGLKASGYLSAEGYAATQQTFLLVGAVISGVVTALLTEGVRRLGGVESSAALGIVFTTLFAAGLVLIRLTADSVHIDADCVLFGNLEFVVLDTFGDTGIPTAALANGLMLLVNLALVGLFYKELLISTFDARLATTVGIHAGVLRYALMAVTAATLVAAFESVGNILVIALLIVPAATASMLTTRLPRLIGLALAVACGSAVLGHVIAITVPAMVFSRLGFPEVRDAGTSGSIAVACGLLFISAVLFAPRRGVISRAVRQFLLRLRIVEEDILGILYRLEEARRAEQTERIDDLMSRTHGVNPLVRTLAIARLKYQGKIGGGAHGHQLTDAGRLAASKLVRSHRLWESYLAKHFALPEDHLHEAAERVEHHIGPADRAQLVAELDSPDSDPHGRKIPPEQDEKNESQ